jgi:PIN domain nuclease of toxin-antitoxin system
VGITNPLLLDTHTFLWAIFEPERLSGRVRRWLANPAQTLYLSVASVWEIELKHRKGKLQAEPSVVDRHMTALGIQALVITVTHVRTLATLEQAGHKDPFDRLIAAQAVVEDLPLVTADPAFAEYTQVKVKW